MKKILFACLLFPLLVSHAQDYLSGKLIDKVTGQKEILYDRTQNDISFNVYQTVYKVINLDKKPVCSITLTHNRAKGILFLSIKPYGGDPIG